MHYCCTRVCMVCAAASVWKSGHTLGSRALCLLFPVSRNQTEVARFVRHIPLPIRQARCPEPTLPFTTFCLVLNSSILVFWTGSLCVALARLGVGPHREPPDPAS